MNDIKHTPAPSQAFRQEFERQFDLTFAKSYQGERLTHRNAPGLLTEVERLYKAAGFKHPPMLYRAEVYPDIRPRPNAGGLPLPLDLEGVVIVNKPLLRAMDYTNLHAPPPTELSAVIAHELGHLRDPFFSGMAKRYLPLIAMPVVAIGALALYDRSRRRAQEHGDDPRDPAKYQAHLDQVMKEGDKTGERPAMLSPPPSPGEETIMLPADPEARSHYLNAMRYIAAGAAGVGAGGLMSRAVMLEAEYRADRTAVALMGSADPLINAFRKIREYNHSIGGKYLECQPAKDVPWIKRQLKELWHAFSEYTINAHPDFRSRLANMRDFESRLIRSGQSAIEHGAIHI